MNKIKILSTIAFLIFNIFSSLCLAQAKPILTAPVPVQVAVSVSNANWVETISICNNSSSTIPLSNVEFDFNYALTMPTNIWGQPWVAWKVIKQNGTAVVLTGGAAGLSLPADPNCTKPLTIQFNAPPTAAAPTGPFIFKAEGGQTTSSGTLAINLPAAPAANVSSPTVIVTGANFSQQQSVAWKGSWKIANLVPGNYTIAASPVNNGTNYYAATNIAAAVVNQQTTTKTLSYTAVPSGNVAIKLINPPTQTQTITFTGKQYSLSKTVNNGTSFTLPADTYAVTSVAAGYSATATPNPIIIPSNPNLTVTYTQNQSTTTNGPFTTSGGQIVDKNNKPTTFKGVNWFGFNTSNHVVHGLWQSDFTIMLNQIISLGFNAVRIPFQFDFILDTSIKPNSITLSCNGKACNTDVPQDSAFNTFQWIIKKFTDNGIYVLLDDHYEDNLYVTSQSQWIAGWKKIAQTFINNPLVGYDLYNEPDSHGLTWESNASGTAWMTGITSAASAIYTIDPKKLIFIEGTNQGALGANWGDGFATDTTAISQGVSNPKNLFTALAKAPYLNQLVVSPHIYGPDGTNGGGPDHSNQTTAYAVWSRLNGYLFNNFLSVNNTTQSGFCVNTACHLYPIAIGEFGGKFDPADPFYTQDVATLTNLATYLVRLGSGKAAQPSWFYWDWNPNSGNTGGILKDDWATIDCNKVNYLKKYLSLTPKAGICS